MREKTEMRRLALDLVPWLAFAVAYAVGARLLLLG